MRDMATVLIVEDDPALRESIAEILSDEYSILCAGDGQEALDMVEQTQPDIVLSDIGMPRLSGFDMLTALRNRRETESLPVIMLSARGDRESIRRCMELGADDYIPKPFLAAEVTKAIGTRLSRLSVIRRPLNELQESLSLSLPHEFRTPLNGILGFASLIQDLAAETGPVNREELGEWASYILDSGTRLLRLVEKFTFHARVLTRRRREGGPPTALTSTGWSSQAVENVRDLASGAERTDDLSVSLSAADVAVETDYLDQCIGELVENALTYSPKGTPVTVTGDADADADDGMYRIVVADVGRGMAREQVAAIGPYAQFDRKAHEQQGLGLGLATVNQIAGLFRGELEIDSTPGAGTTVRLSFPLARTGGV